MNKWKSIFPLIVMCSFLLFSACNKSKEPSEGNQPGVQITKEEQQSFEGCLEPGMLTQQSAVANLKILVAGDHETINYYREYEQSENRMPAISGEAWYENDICAAVKVLSRRKNPEAYDLILQVIENKSKYNKAMVCAIRAIMIYGKFEDGFWHGDKRSISVLKEVANNEDPDIRLHASGALLSLGEGDIALPVLDKLVKAGSQHSIPAIHKLFTPEEIEEGGIKKIIRSNTRLFDERGKDILVRALNYSSDEVKVFAALKLAHLGIDEKRVEDTAIKILKQRTGIRKTGYQNMEERQRERNTVNYAIAALETIASTDGAVVIRALNENYNDSLINEKANSTSQIITPGNITNNQ